MSVGQILSKAQAMGVRLSLNGDTVKLRGPANAIATIKPELAAHKPEIVAHLRHVTTVPADCLGALRDPDGGLYLPWGGHLSPNDACRMSGELIDMIETLADMENWPPELRDDVRTRALRGPLADLLPNYSHFRERLDAARAAGSARTALEMRSWHLEGLADRHYCEACNGSCFGTAKRCGKLRK